MSLDQGIQYESGFFHQQYFPQNFGSQLNGAYLVSLRFLRNIFIELFSVYFRITTLAWPTWSTTLAPATIITPTRGSLHPTTSSPMSSPPVSDPAQPPPSSLSSTLLEVSTARKSSSSRRRRVIPAGRSQARPRWRLRSSFRPRCWARARLAPPGPVLSQTPPSPPACSPVPATSPGWTSPPPPAVSSPASPAPGIFMFRNILTFKICSC